MAYLHVSDLANLKAQLSEHRVSPANRLNQSLKGRIGGSLAELDRKSLINHLEAKDQYI